MFFFFIIKYILLELEQKDLFEQEVSVAKIITPHKKTSLPYCIRDDAETSSSLRFHNFLYYKYILQNVNQIDTLIKGQFEV